MTLEQFAKLLFILLERNARSGTMTVRLLRAARIK
jgi:hypothetical protein